MNTIADFTKLVNLCLDAARAKYGNFGDVEIRFDLRGRASGMACCKLNPTTGRAYAFQLRFNREALQKDWNYMVQNTIPHEVAHIVSYAKPELGAKGHNIGWKLICQALGGASNRCHKMNLTPARRRFKYRYVLESGTVVVAGPKHHKMIQLFGTKAGIRVKSTQELVDRHHFKESVVA